MGKKRRKLVKRKFAHLQRNIHYVNPTPEGPTEDFTTIKLVQPQVVEPICVIHEPVPVTKPTPIVNLGKMFKRQLMALATEMGITTISKKNTKNEIIAAIESRN